VSSGARLARSAQAGLLFGALSWSCAPRPASGGRPAPPQKEVAIPTPEPEVAEEEPAEALPERDAEPEPTTRVAPGNCCKGMNECKGKGGCAVHAQNDCAGKNECKGKGGCKAFCPR
jgi:hypothetical protein